MCRQPETEEGDSEAMSEYVYEAYEGGEGDDTSHYYSAACFNDRYGAMHCSFDINNFEMLKHIHLTMSFHSVVSD